MRAANMQALTADLERRWPGVTIYGIGDAAHKLEISDHNEDDTPGSKSAQTDSDSVPEHRAIDAMHTAGFTFQEGKALVAKMVADLPSRRRLLYIIHDHMIWSRSNNWVGVKYDGDDPHTNHVHFSGWAGDDENASSWPVVFAASGSGPTPPRLRRQWPFYMPNNHYFGDIHGPAQSHGGYYAKEKPDVEAIQARLNSIGFNCGSPDGVFGHRTVAAVSAWQKKLYSSTTSYFGQVWHDDWMHLFTY